MDKGTGCGVQISLLCGTESRSVGNSTRHDSSQCHKILPGNKVYHICGDDTYENKGDRQHVQLETSALE